MLETKHAPWNLPNDVNDYAKAIEDGPLVRGMLSLNKYERWTTEQIVAYTRKIV